MTSGNKTKNREIKKEKKRSVNNGSVYDAGYKGQHLHNTLYKTIKKKTEKQNANRK